jgi:glycosyltransferase involved in cell wall biosynthesis
MTREPRSPSVKANAPKSAVLVLTSTFPRWRGDVEPPFVHELSRRLTDSFDVHVLAPHAPGSKRREILDGVHVYRFRYGPTILERLAYQGGILANLKKSPYLFGLVPLFLAAQLLAAIKLLVRQPIEVIHAHWIFPQGGIAMLARALSRSRAKVLCTSHGGDLYGLKGAVLNRFKKIVADACDHLTVVSRSMRGDLMKLGVEPSKVSVIPMGVDLRYRFVPPSVPSRAESLLFVGRLVEKKGLRYLLEAMPEILKRLPQAYLTVVGDGPSRLDLEKLASDLGLRERVRFLGALKNEELPAVYQRAGIVVFPSMISDDGDQEGFGLVLVEALGCGCAAVVTDLPAMMDIVEDGKTAIVVRQKNPGEIAVAVIRLLAYPELRSAIVRNGRRHVLESFDWRVIVPSYRAVLDKAIKAAGPG